MFFSTVLLFKAVGKKYKPSIRPIFSQNLDENLKKIFGVALCFDKENDNN